MTDFFIKKGRFAIVYSAVLVLFTTFVLLDAFVIPREHELSAEDEQTAVTQTALSETVQTEAAETVVTEPAVYGYDGMSYTDEHIRVKIEEVRVDDTTAYVADVVLSDAEHLKTALAYGKFGRNITQKTSVTAKENDAVLAVNGDFCGFRNEGFVIRNGFMYRSVVRTQGDTDVLAVFADGRFEVYNENNMPAKTLLKAGAVQAFSFGPALIDDGSICVKSRQEISSQSMESNPRTAIGMVEPLHYVFVVADGRTEESSGLSLYQLATLMQDYGCTVAYNLDGGGSSTMYFNGEIVNKPTTNGKKITERKVSDIVYIG